MDDGSNVIDISGILEDDAAREAREAGSGIIPTQPTPRPDSASCGCKSRRMKAMHVGVLGAGFLLGRYVYGR